MAWRTKACSSGQCSAIRGPESLSRYQSLSSRRRVSWPPVKADTRTATRCVRCTGSPRTASDSGRDYRAGSLVEFPFDPVGHRTRCRRSTLASIASRGFSATISKIVGAQRSAPRSIVAIASNGTVPVPIWAWLNTSSDVSAAYMNDK